jgi:endo-1,4-beta-xylanase
VPSAARIPTAVPAKTVGADVVVLGADGSPLADTDVVVEQTAHAFGFGNIGFDFLPLVGGPAPEGVEDVEAFGTASSIDLDTLADAWLGLFNQVTLPFYWGRYEPRRGEPDRERLRRTAQWFADRGVTVKGHPLLWHTITPSWLAGLPLDEVEQLQRERSRGLTAEFAGLIDVWDAINEAVIMPVFENGANRITDLARASSNASCPRATAAASRPCGSRSRRRARATRRRRCSSTTSTSAPPTSA